MTFFRKLGIAGFSLLIMFGVAIAYINDVERVTKVAVKQYMDQLRLSFEEEKSPNEVDISIYQAHKSLSAPDLNGTIELEVMCVEQLEEKWPSKSVTIVFKDNLLIENNHARIVRSLRADYGTKTIKQDSLYVEGKFVWDGSNLIFQRPDGNLKNLTGSLGFGIVGNEHGGFDIESRFGPECWTLSSSKGSRTGHFIPKVD